MSDGTVVSWWVITKGKRNLHFPDYSWTFRKLCLFRSTGRTMTWTLTTIFAPSQPTAESCPGRSSRSDSKITSACFHDLLANVSYPFSLVPPLLWRFLACAVWLYLTSATQWFLFFLSFPQNELIFTDILRLSVDVSASEDRDGGQPVSLDGKFMGLSHIRYENQSGGCLKSMFMMWVMLLCIVSGTSFDFHKQTDHLFLVGTEDGKIHKVCKNCGTDNSVAFN